MYSIRIAFPTGAVTDPTDIYSGATLITFAPGSIISLSESTAVSMVGEELYIDNFTAKVRFTNAVPRHFKPTDFDYFLTQNQQRGVELSYILFGWYQDCDLRLLPYGSICELMDGNTVVARYYSESVKRIGRDAYEIKAISGIGIMSRQRSVGGIISGVPFPTVVASILGDVCRGFEYTIDDQGAGTGGIDTGLAAMKVYGWLPFSTKRQNLHQLLVAYGVNLVQGTNGALRFSYLNDEQPEEKPNSEIYLGGSVEYNEPASRLEVVEHAFDYRSYMEDEVLFDNTTSWTPAEDTLVVFDHPIDPDTIHVESPDQTLVITPYDYGWTPNMLDGVTWVTGYYLAKATGAPTESQNFRYTSEYLEILPGSSCHFSAQVSVTSGYVRIHEYGQDKGWLRQKVEIRNAGSSQLTEETWTASDDAYYVRLSVRIDATDVLLERQVPKYHENFVVVTGIGKVIGRAFMHTEELFAVDNPDAIAERNVRVDAATLITFMNSPNVLKRLEEYYFHAKKTKTSFVRDGEMTGRMYAFDNPFDEGVRGFLTSMTTVYSHVDKANIELLEDYEPTAWGTSFTDVAVITKDSASKTFTITQDILDKPWPVIRIVLIGRGYRGADGDPGDDGHGYQDFLLALNTGSINNMVKLINKPYTGGSGGAGGIGGDGGKIHSFVVNVAELGMQADDTITFTFDQSAAADDTHPAGNFATKVTIAGVTHSSENGFPNADGFRDPISNTIYGKKGIDGLPGVSGGQGGYYHDDMDEEFHADDPENLEDPIPGQPGEACNNHSGGRASEQFKVKDMPYYFNVSWDVGSRTYMAGAGGGGASWDNAGDDALNIKGYPKTDPDYDSYWNEHAQRIPISIVPIPGGSDQFANKRNEIAQHNIAVLGVALKGGAGGAGAMYETTSPIFGAGGTGGNGGGGGGGGALCTITQLTDKDKYRATLFIGDGGDGGAGGSGRDGSKGCALIYY